MALIADAAGYHPSLTHLRCKGDVGCGHSGVHLERLDRATAIESCDRKGAALCQWKNVLPPGQVEKPRQMRKPRINILAASSGAVALMSQATKPWQAKKANSSRGTA